MGSCEINLLTIRAAEHIWPTTCAAVDRSPPKAGTVGTALLDGNTTILNGVVSAVLRWSSPGIAKILEQARQLSCAAPEGATTVALVSGIPSLACARDVDVGYLAARTPLIQVFESVVTVVGPGDVAHVGPVGPA